MALYLKQGISKQITKLNMKTSTFLEENKIKTYIATLEADIQELKMKAGENGYAMWSAGRLDVAQLVPLYQEIALKQRQIQEQEQQMKELIVKNQQVLGQSAPEAPVPPAAPAGPAPAGNAVFCPKCGEACAPTVNFCKRCGNKLR